MTCPRIVTAWKRIHCVGSAHHDQCMQRRIHSDVSPFSLWRSAYAFGLVHVVHSTRCTPCVDSRQVRRDLVLCTRSRHSIEQPRRCHLGQCRSPPRCPASLDPLHLHDRSVLPSPPRCSLASLLWTARFVRCQRLNDSAHLLLQDLRRERFRNEHATCSNTLPHLLSPAQNEKKSSHFLAVAHRLSYTCLHGFSRTWNEPRSPSETTVFIPNCRASVRACSPTTTSGA